MAERTQDEEACQQPDKGRTTTTSTGLSQTRLGHQDHHRGGRQDLRGAGAGVVSERQKYHVVERYRLDTWAFVAFFAIMAVITHI
jgi:hypothetical protein